MRVVRQEILRHGVVAICLLLAATSAAAAPVTVAWDKSSDARVRGYMVFVGTRPNDPLSAFDVGAATSYQFSTGSPSGTLYFSVASYGADRVPGSRSPEVMAVIGGGTVPVPPGSARVASLDSQSVRAVPRNACFDDGQCFDTSPVLHVSGHVGSMIVDSFGQLYFVEGDSRIRVVSPSGASDVVLDGVSSNARVLALAIDPQFAVTRRVFVAEASGRDGGTFDIARYRNVANQFGEHAVIVPGLPQGNVPPLLAVDSDAHVFAILPAASPTRLGFGGLVTRFNDDGAVPRDNPGGNVVFSRGYDTPTAAVADPANHTLVLTGANRNSTTGVVQLPADGAAHPPVASEVVLQGRDGQVIRARRQTGGGYQLSTMTIPGAVAVAASPGAPLYVAVADADGGTDIIRLNPTISNP